MESVLETSSKHSLVIQALLQIVRDFGLLLRHLLIQILQLQHLLPVLRSEHL